MNVLNRIGKLIPVAICITLLSACSAPTFNMPMKKPELTNFKYDRDSNESHVISVSDSREPTALFSEGTLNYNVQIDGKNIDEVDYITTAIVDELTSRGLPTSADSTSEDAAKLNIVAFKILNQRVSGFSPLVTFTQFSGDFTVNGETKRIVSFIKRAKVPIWHVVEDSIVENTFNQPMTLLVQDVATRISQSLSDDTISDKTVDSLVAEINDKALDKSIRYMKVYQLGFGNNKAAIPHLLNLIDDSDDYVRLAVISSLGLLDAKSEVTRLISIFNTAKLWQDKAMALKSLADLNTAESKMIVDAEWNRISEMKKPSKEAKWNKEILSLYR